MMYAAATAAGIVTHPMFGTESNWKGSKNTYTHVIWLMAIVYAMGRGVVRTRSVPVKTSFKEAMLLSDCH